MGISQKIHLTESLKSVSRRLKAEIYTVYFAARDSRTPWYVKVIALLVAGYALSPIDLIPDFIPIFGYLDDLILLPLGISLVLRLTPDEVLNDARKKSMHLKSQKGLSSWIGALFIVMIWIVLFFWMIAFFWPAY